MSTDRELIEWAAKAGGIELHTESFFLNGLTRRVNVNGSRFGITPWNPLTDDGDALRLLCKCSMRIVEERGGAYRAVQYTLYAEDDEETVEEVEIEWPHTPEQTQYAITLAAAAIGKGMK